MVRKKREEEEKVYFLLVVVFLFFFSVVVFGNVEWLGNVFIFGKFIVGFGFSWGVSSLLTRSSCFCEGIAFSQPFGNGA